MKYIKIVLTVIAVLLALNMIKPLLIKESNALTTAVDVNIIGVGNRTVYSGMLPVKIMK